MFKNPEEICAYIFFGQLTATNQHAVSTSLEESNYNLPHCSESNTTNTVLSEGFNSTARIISHRLHPGPSFFPGDGSLTESSTQTPKLSLRLLPAIIMDNEEDDDGNFTKWMSSYWGHGAGEDHAKARKRSFMRYSCIRNDRRASLPCMSQLEAMQNQIHANVGASVHLVTREEKEMHSHPRARRVSSDESRTKVVGPECHIPTIPELSETLEKRLRFHNQKLISTGDTDSICLICHDKLRNSRGGIQELHCAHHFHKERKGLEHGARPRSRSSAAACDRGKEVPFCHSQEEYHSHHRQLSLRRQR